MRRARAFGRMAEASPGKDSVTGHWELMGLVLDRPFPVFPDGFPPDVMRAFEQRIGRRTLGNKAASGTAIIDELGPEHMRTGSPDRLHVGRQRVPDCRARRRRSGAGAVPILRDRLRPGGRWLGVGRVIARPFVGQRRRVPADRQPARLRADAVCADAARSADRGAGRQSSPSARSKISSPAAASRAPCTRRATRTAWTKSSARSTQTPRGLIFANLVDFDTVYGHRNDPAGYAANLERFDARLAALLPRLGPGDLLVVTADHGNDPTTPSTDHSREHVPLLVYGPSRARRRRSRDARDVRGLGSDARRVVRRRAAGARHELSCRRF